MSDITLDTPLADIVGDNKDVSVPQGITTVGDMLSTYPKIMKERNDFETRVRNPKAPDMYSNDKLHNNPNVKSFLEQDESSFKEGFGQLDNAAKEAGLSQYQRDALLSAFYDRAANEINQINQPLTEWKAKAEKEFGNRYDEFVNAYEEYTGAEAAGVPLDKIKQVIDARAAAYNGGTAGKPPSGNVQNYVPQNDVQKEWSTEWEGKHYPINPLDLNEMNKFMGIKVEHHGRKVPLVRVSPQAEALVKKANKYFADNYNAIQEHNATKRQQG